MRGLELGRDFLATRLHAAVAIKDVLGLIYGNGASFIEGHLFHSAEMTHSHCGKYCICYRALYMLSRSNRMLCPLKDRSSAQYPLSVKARGQARVVMVPSF